MPLIIVTGLPTSGKSTRARQLLSYLAARIEAPPGAESAAAETAATASRQPRHHHHPHHYRLHLISDSGLSIPRTVYDLSPAQVPAHARSANASEKDARAAVYAAVKRVLSDRDLVVLDGMNYIKGWRYQLFCEARAASTPSVVLQVGCAVEKARSVNEERLARREGEEGERGSGEPVWAAEPTDDEEPYEPTNWENLVFRYEEPNGMNRWDSPLFALGWDDDEAQTRATFDRLWDAIAGEARRRPRPNNATAQRTRDVGADYLSVLEGETQDVVRRVLDQQAEGGGGSSGGKSGGNNLAVDVPAGRTLGLAQLQRHRRAFVGLNRGGIGLENVGSLAVDRIQESFVNYLNDCFEREA